MLSTTGRLLLSETLQIFTLHYNWSLTQAQLNLRGQELSNTSYRRQITQLRTPWRPTRASTTNSEAPRQLEPVYEATRTSTPSQLLNPESTQRSTTLSGLKICPMRPVQTGATPDKRHENTCRMPRTLLDRGEQEPQRRTMPPR